MTDLENITVYFPLILSNAIQKLIDDGIYQNRSQIIRICLNEFLDKEEEFRKSLELNPEKTKKMVLTINIFKRQNKQITRFTGNRGKGQYPSRSELIRVALRDFLIKEKHIKDNNLCREITQTPKSKSYIKELILNQCGLSFINYSLRKKGFSGISQEIYHKMKQKLIDEGQIKIFNLKSGEIIEIIAGE